MQQGSSREPFGGHSKLQHHVGPLTEHHTEQKPLSCMRSSNNTRTRGKMGVIPSVVLGT